MVQYIDLSPGDTLFLYSDGLSEASDMIGNQYGVDGLSRVLLNSHSLSPGEIAVTQLREMENFSSGAEQIDDLTIMVVRRAG